jgi:hypothetical protein
MDIQDILQRVGFSLRDDGKFWRAKAFYRDGGNPMSVRISKEDGSFCDFSTNQTGDLKKLVSLAVGSSMAESFDIEKVLPDCVESKKKLVFQNNIDIESIGTLVKSYKYFLDRGVSKETLDTFGARLALSGKMYKRIIFPIYDMDLNVVGVSGRSVIGSPIKWKHMGLKRNWAYPIHLNRPIIQQSKTLILVEGISDVLALWDVGIKNVFCLFGTKMMPFLISEIIKLSPKKILLATNNEPDNFDIGAKAAQEIQRKLSVFFSPSVTSIALPYKKDFSDQTKEENLRWKEQYLPIWQ